MAVPVAVAVPVVVPVAVAIAAATRANGRSCEPVPECLCPRHRRPLSSELRQSARGMCKSSLAKMSLGMRVTVAYSADVKCVGYLGHRIFCDG